MECVFDVLVDFLGGVILCYTLINPYLCGEFFCAGGCMYYIGVTMSHIAFFFLDGERVCRINVFL